jgi:hypothetical protein
MQSGEWERAGSGKLKLENGNFKSTNWETQLHGRNAMRRLVGAVRAAMQTDARSSGKRVD